MASGEYDLGLLACGTGVGISMAANKVPGARAVVCSEPYTARLSREHNASNIVSVGARVVGPGEARMIVEAFLAANHNRDLLTSPIPGTFPNLLLDYMLELKDQTEKKTKTISLNSTLTAASWRLIRHGFWFGHGEDLVFFPMPSAAELEQDHHAWARAAKI